MSYDFETTSYGKWILAGEHAVLRGHPALVFPLKDKALRLTYKKSNTPLTLKYQGENADTCLPAIWKLLHAGFEKLGLDSDQLQGELHLINQIPIGAGLGASAALCVAITRWFKTDFNAAINLFKFAKSLEDTLHGQSSGLDIAGSAATEHGIYFQAGEMQPVTQTWEPHWQLSFSGESGVTSECIQQVEKLWKQNRRQAECIDDAMAKSVTQAHAALRDPKHQTSLIEAIQSASQCFESWGLINQPLRKHMDELLAAGALAVKPTGSGQGGYVLSLWDNSPSQ